jgi:hypothetical protein
MKRRFREIVDEAFDGNFSMASRELEMPLSTVHQYYQKGPRRIDARVAARIEALLKVSTAWLLGEEGSDEDHPQSQYTTYESADSGRQYSYPPLVDWRVKRVKQELTKRLQDRREALEVLFEPLATAEKERIVTGLDMTTGALPTPEQYDEWGDRMFRTNRLRAHVVHALCNYWEDLLKNCEGADSQ